MNYTALISATADEFINVLQKDYSILRIPPDDRLDVPVATHTDMNVFLLKESAVISFGYDEKYPHIRKYLENEC